MAELQQRVLELPVPGHQASHPGAAGGKPLRDRVHNDQIVVNIPEMGHGGDPIGIVVAELPVDLVADQEQVVLLGNIRDHAHLVLIQDHPRGIAGVGNEDGPGIFGNKLFDPPPVGITVALLRAGGQGPDHAARRMDKGGVIGIVGLGDNDLRIGVQN